jgi:hypothetical protein
MVHAQFSPVVTPESVFEGQPVNIYTVWESEESIDGFHIELPEDWQLNAVQVSEMVGADPLETSIELHETAGGSTYRVAVEAFEAGRYQNIFQVQVGSRTGKASWKVTPFVAVEEEDSLLTDRQHTGDVEVERSYLLAGQYAVTFDGRVPERPGLKVDGRAVGLALDEPFTVEFWMKSVQVREVILSTWDAREESAYPMEIMIDSHGYLNGYRRSEGLHHSLRSSRPIADGKWHHVAFTHERATGWTRLIVDGQTTDSLHVSNEPASSDVKPLILGGRGTSSVGGPEGDPPEINFTGALDELRIWREARKTPDIARAMHRQIDTEPDGVVRLGFDNYDEGEIERRFTEGRASMLFVQSALSLFDPIEQISARRQAEGVQVTWEAMPSYSEAFVVERSTDGQYFEEVSRVSAETLEQSDARRYRRYSVIDPTVHEGVVFYRVRQVVSDGERQPMAKTIKLGLRSPRMKTADLVGNFPNPFNSTTVIKYELHETQHVRLEVWDMSGHRRALLVDKTQETGLHDVRFEAANLPSGAYVIRLETERATQTHAMILMK